MNEAQPRGHGELGVPLSTTAFSPAGGKRRTERSIHWRCAEFLACAAVGDKYDLARPDTQIFDSVILSSEQAQSLERRDRGAPLRMAWSGRPMLPAKLNEYRGPVC
jgi:hypothetical protein